MKVLVGCEESQVVTSAFRALGHEAYSCDLLPTRGRAEWHFQCDVFSVIGLGWDIGIFHPDCTYLANSGNRWHSGSQQRAQAIEFVERLWDAAACIPRVCVENPVGALSTKSRLGSPSQIIHPWQYGHGETKATCLWLRALPLLTPTNVVPERVQRVWKMSPGPFRKRDRSTTYLGWAEAMAAQWGTLSV